MNNIYLTSYNKLVGGEIVKFAGPDIKAKNSASAMTKARNNKRTSRLPLQVDGKLICKIRK